MEQDSQTSSVNTLYKVVSSIRTVLVYLVAAAMILAAVVFAAGKKPDKAIFGYRYYVVLTDSMAPAFRSGDMVLVKICSPDSIETGDVITFNPSSGSDAYLTHRVTEKLIDYQGTGVTCFRTKGDANETEDSFLIDENRLIGKVQVSVPRLGFVIRFIQLRWYYIIPLIVLLFVFFGLLQRYAELRAEQEQDHQEDDA